MLGKKLILFFILFVGVIRGQSSSVSSPTFWDNVIGNWGFGICLWDIRAQYPNTSITSSFPAMQTLNVGGKYSYISHGDFVALNLGAQLQLALRFSSPMDYYVGVPLFVMGNIGAASTPYNENVIGAGLGGGARIAYLNMNFVNTANSSTTTLSQAYMTPFVVGELTIMNYSFRLYVDVMPFPIKFQIDPINSIDANISSLQVELNFIIR